ncbi:MAG: hypothetical protein LUE20_10440 [Oscillospiraceae bacterium]|nr:hypothetical protein [Oscillospiraceae bacterium]
MLESEKKRFSELLERPKEELLISAGVGTLSEKYLHAVFKYYYEPNPDYHEVGIDRFTADICRDRDIIEIQTRSLKRLREKLEYYISAGYYTTVVYPIPHKKWLSWLDPETGELTPKRRSPKTGTAFDSIYELYGIKDYLSSGQAQVVLELVDVWDIKNQDGYGRGRKHRATRNDRIPLELYDEIILSEPEDYLIFLPEALPEEFTRKDYSKLTRLDGLALSGAIKILEEMGLIEFIGQDGKKYVYRKGQ